MKRTLTAWTVISAGLFAIEASAELPTYTFELQARSSVSAAPVGAFNLPVASSITNERIEINDDRQVAFGLTDNVVDSIWVGGGGNGQIVYAASNEDWLVGTPSMNGGGQVVFRVESSGDDGVWTYAGGNTTKLFDGPAGATGWSSPQLTDAGEVGFRANVAGRKHIALWDGTQASSLAIEDDGYDFLFSPATADGPWVAAKITDPASGNQIRRFDPNGDSVLIAGTDANSVYSDFDNGVDVNFSGQVAFVGRLADGREVVLSDGVTNTVIATEGMGSVAEIGFFRPVVNDSGLVAFRGVADDGLRAIFIGDGTDLKAVVKEHDLLPTDNGDGRLDQSDASAPIFSAEPQINARGDIAFAAGLAPPMDDQVDWGTGVFVAYSDQEPPGGDDMGMMDDTGGVPDAGPMNNAPTGDAGTDPSGNNSTVNNAGTTNGATGNSGQPTGGGMNAGGSAENSGTDDGCCSTIARSALPPWLMVVPILLIGLRRRRRCAKSKSTDRTMDRRVSK